MPGMRGHPCGSRSRSMLLEVHHYSRSIHASILASKSPLNVDASLDSCRQSSHTQPGECKTQKLPEKRTVIPRSVTLSAFAELDRSRAKLCRQVELGE